MHCRKFNLSPQHTIHILITFCDGVIIWAFINFSNCGFSIMLHAIRIGVKFYWSIEIFPHSIIIISNILKIRIILYRCIGIGGIKLQLTSAVDVVRYSCVMNYNYLLGGWNGYFKIRIFLCLVLLILMMIRVMLCLYYVIHQLY